MSISSPSSSASREIVAAYIPQELMLSAEHPSSEWRRADPVCFCSDWQGNHNDPGRETRVRALWSDRTFFLRFDCRFRELYLFSDSDADRRRDCLWDRDVAEAFLQPDPCQTGYYKEFEVSPNAMWIDLDIFPGGHNNLKSGMRASVVLDEPAKTWAAELAIPLQALTGSFDPGEIWRANFYRVEGKQEPRAYLAWQPTCTPEPNFHVSDKFGYLRFAK